MTGRGGPVGQRSLLLGSLLGLAVPVLHMREAGVGEIAKSSGGFRFVWMLLANRRDLALLPHPRNTRAVESAMGPVPVVQHPEHGKASRAA